MDHFISNLKVKFLEGDLLLRLLYINIGMFLLIRLADVLLMLFNYPFAPILRYLEFPSAPMEFLLQPWSLLTYMFTHYDVLHILFNMLWLYWFGRMFLTYFDARKLFGVYLLGGIFGALLFMVAYNLFPYYADAASCSYLLGASASVMAVVFGVSFYARDAEVMLFGTAYSIARSVINYFGQCRRSSGPYRRSIIWYLVCLADAFGEGLDPHVEPTTGQRV